MTIPCGLPADRQRPSSAILLVNASGCQIDYVWTERRA
jgi:hypothetical protein